MYCIWISIFPESWFRNHPDCRMSHVDIWQFEGETRKRLLCDKVIYFQLNHWSTMESEDFSFSFMSSLKLKSSLIRLCLFLWFPENTSLFWLEKWTLMHLRIREISTLFHLSWIYSNSDHVYDLSSLCHHWAYKRVPHGVGLNACRARCSNEMASAFVQTLLFFKPLWIMMITAFVPAIIRGWLKTGWLNKSTFISRENRNILESQSCTGGRDDND